MKITFFCWIVWIAIFVYYLEKNCEAIFSSPKKDQKKFDLFKADLAKFCKRHRNDDECEQSVVTEVNVWPATKERNKMVENFLKMIKLIKKMERKSGKRSLTALLEHEPTAGVSQNVAFVLREAVTDKLDEIARSIFDYRLLKIDDFRFPALWYLHTRVLDLVANPNGKDIKTRLSEKMELVYNDLGANAQDDCGEFINGLKPDRNVKLKLYLFWLDSKISNGMEGPELAGDVCRRFSANVKHYTLDCYGESYKAYQETVRAMINLDKVRFLRFVARKATEVLSKIDKRNYESLDVTKRTEAIYREVIRAYGKILKKEIDAKGQRERTDNQNNFIVLYHENIERYNQ